MLSACVRNEVHRAKPTLTGQYVLRQRKKVLKCVLRLVTIFVRARPRSLF